MMTMGFIRKEFMNFVEDFSAKVDLLPVSLIF